MRKLDSYQKIVRKLELDNKLIIDKEAVNVRISISKTGDPGHYCFLKSAYWIMHDIAVATKYHVPLGEKVIISPSERLYIVDFNTLWALYQYGIEHNYTFEDREGFYNKEVINLLSTQYRGLKIKNLKNIINK